MSKYRKGVDAIVGALVVIANQLGVPVAEDISESVVVLVTALLVIALRND